MHLNSKKSAGVAPSRAGSSLAAIAVAGLVWMAPTSASADCDVMYRLWEDGTNTYYNYGETLRLVKGQKVDLYIHYKSRSPTPYSTQAQITPPADLEVGTHRRRDVERVLRLTDNDPGSGKQRIEAVAKGATALGYRITGVKHPGKLENIPARCRVGEVRFVVDRDPTDSRSLEDPTPAAETASEAAHQLVGELMASLLRREGGPGTDYPNEWFDRVQADGLRGLISVAEIIVSSQEFQTAALERTRQSLAATGVSTGSLSQGVVQDQLLTDIMVDLYGRDLGDGPRRRLLSQNLASCLGGRGKGGCQQFGRNLVSQSEYHDANSDLLRHWQRY